MEKRYWLWLFIIGLTVGIGCLVGYSLAHAYFSDVEARLQMLETQYAASLKAGQEIKLEEIKILIAKSEESVKDQARLLIWIGLPGTIIALLAAIFAAFKWAAEFAKDEAKAAFKDPDSMLKEGKSILVITPNGSDASWLAGFFQKMDFNPPTFKLTSQIDDLAGEKYDIAILNAPDDPPKQTSPHNDLIRKMTMAKSVFYFGPGFVNNAQLDNLGKLSFANAKSQLYGNLINALKFQKVLS